MKSLFPYVAFFLALNVLLQAEPLELPWFTDPLLTPTPFCVKPGHQSIHPYVHWREKTEEYDAWWKSQPVRYSERVLFQPIFKFGVFPRTELDLLPELFYKHTHGANSWQIGDFPVNFSVQLVEEDKLKNKTLPDIKLRFNVVFPTGNYDRLSPKKLDTDSSGQGSWYPGVTLLLGKYFHFSDTYWLAMRFACGYSFGTAVPVHGLSTYGGETSTRGKAYPGNLLFASWGMELTVTRRIALALDLAYDHANKTRFSVKKGEEVATKPSSELFRIAPGIEYNHSEKWGFIMGPALAIAGRNAPTTFSWIVSMNLRH